MNNISVHTPDPVSMKLAQQHWNNVAKPLGSLGCFEKLVVRIAGIQRTENIRLSKRCALIYCGDHGVVKEGVTQSGSEITALVAHSITEGSANINLMANAASCDVFAVDMGMLADFDHPNLICKKIAHGTNNIAEGPAMTRFQAEEAIYAGIDTIRMMKEAGYDAAVIGEMGIGNTTATATMASLLLNVTPQSVTGRGAGLSNEAFRRKCLVIEKAISINTPVSDDPIDVLSKTGGFEIAGMTGAFLGAMIWQMPVIIDGVISAVAALTAERICSECKYFRIPSHMSNEPAARLLMEALKEEPVLHAGMALGEGTGGILMLPLFDMVLRVYNGSHTFNNLGMEAYTPQGDF